MRRPIRTLYIALVVLHLVPIWAVDYLPTGDGPAHTYNAWVLHGLATGTAPKNIAATYAIDTRPHPNWLGHALMAMCMFVVKPRVAEKILFTTIVIVFLAGAWLLVRDPAIAFLAFPLTFHSLLMSGFYNFSLGAALFALTLGLWWRWRDTPKPWWIAGLVVMCWFAHPMPAMLLIAAIGLLWICVSRRPIHLLAFVPVAPLIAWFVLQRGTGSVPAQRTALAIARYLAQCEIVITFDERQVILGRALFALMALLWFLGSSGSSEFLGIFTRGTEEPRNRGTSFLLLLLAFLALTFFAPSAFAGGQLVTERMTLFVYLLPLPLLAAPWRRSLIALLTIVAIANAAYQLAHFRRLSAYMARFIRNVDPVAPNTLLPLLFDRTTPHSFISVVPHAVAYAAIDKQLVDLDNYEPGTGYFPIRYRAGAFTPDIYELEAHPDTFPLAGYARHAEYVFAWAIPPDAPVRETLRTHYALVAERGAAQIWRSRLLASSVPDVLLPLAGTSEPAGAPGGARWRVDQSVRNDGTTPVSLLLSTCAPPTPCAFELAPGRSMPIIGNARFVAVDVLRGDPSALHFTTIAKRVDVEGVAMAVPAALDRDFRPRLRFEDLPPNERLHLRLWLRGTATALLNGKAIHVDGDGMISTYVDAQTLDVDAKGGRAWGFVTADTHVHLPVNSR